MNGTDEEAVASERLATQDDKNADEIGNKYSHKKQSSSIAGDVEEKRGESFDGEREKSRQRKSRDRNHGSEREGKSDKDNSVASKHRDSPTRERRKSRDGSSRRKSRDDSRARSPSREKDRKESRDRDRRGGSSRRRGRSRASPSPEMRRRHSRSRDRDRRHRSSPTPPRRRRRRSRTPDRHRSRRRHSSSSSSRERDRRRKSGRRSGSREKSRRLRRSSSRDHEEDGKRRDERKSPVVSKEEAQAAPPPPITPFLSAVSPALTAQQQQQQLALSLALGGNLTSNPAALSMLLGLQQGLVPALPGGMSLGMGVGGGVPGVTFLEPKELREMFVGNTPPGTNEMVLLEFLNLAMRHVKLAMGPEGQDPVLTCRMNNKFAFVECRTAEEASRLLHLNNIPFMGAWLKIGRPSKYVGPHTPGKSWQEMLAHSSDGAMTAAQKETGVVGGAAVAPAAALSQQIVIDPVTKPYRELFVGNTSPDMTETQILEFVGDAMEKMGLSSGPGNPVISCRVSPRFAFIELRTIEETANCINISGIPFMGQSLKFGRPTKYTGPSLPYYEWDDLLSHFMTGELKLQTAGNPSPVIRLSNMVTLSDLQSDDSYGEVVEETQSECANFGTVVRVVIPRPGESPSAVGKVFVEMGSIDEAKAALVALKGRTFDERIVDVKFFPLEKLLRGDFSDPPPVVITSRGVTTVDAVIGNSASLTAAQMSVEGSINASLAGAGTLPTAQLGSQHYTVDSDFDSDLRSLAHK